MAYSDVILADSPAAYWRLNETSGTTAADSSGNSNDGTYSAGVTLAQPGLLTSDTDKAAVFNGSTGNVDASSPLTFTPSTGPVSLEAWIKTTQATQGDIFDHKGLNTLRVLLFVLNGKIGSGLGGSSHFGGRVVNDGVPHYVVVTYDNVTDALLLYVDGQQDGSFTVAAENGTGGVMIGSSRTNNFFFQGTIDEPAVYTAVLTPAQVVAHYEAGAALPDYGFTPRDLILG